MFYILIYCSNYNNMSLYSLYSTLYSMITGKQLFNDNLITGKEFKILYPNMKFYLISTKNDNFKDGYNEDLDLLSSSLILFF